MPTPESRRTHTRRRRALAVITVVLSLVSIGANGSTVAATTIEGVDTTTVDDDSTPDTTLPESGSTAPPDSTEPSDPSLPPEAEVAPDTEDSDDNAAVTALAVVASLGLLLVAVWWMLRRGDDHGPPTDPDWPDRSEVI